jgi:hypothetical protein
MPHTNGRRLFFGFEHRSHWLSVIALDGRGLPLLRAQFPLDNAYDFDLGDEPVADIATTLQAFLRTHQARAVCCTDRTPGFLELLAERLGGPVRTVDLGELERYGMPGHDPFALRRPLGTEAHQRALLAGLAAATLEDA